MAILYENFTGSDCSGTDKAIDRVLNSVKTPKFIVVERKTLRPEIDYTVNNNEITFKINIDNRWRITVFSSSLGLSQREPPPLFLFANLIIEIKVSIEKTAEISIGFSFDIEKEASLEIDLSAGVSKNAEISTELNVSISKEATETIKISIETEMDNLLLSDVVELL